MTVRVLPFLLILLYGGVLCEVAAAEWEPGTTHRLIFDDVDGNTLSTSDGHVTILTVATRAEEEKARAVADLVPDRYLGDEKFRYVTLVNFQGKIPGPFRGITRAVIRNRLAAEAEELKPQYAAKKIARDPRNDIHVIADFDGSATERLGLSPESATLAVFIFDAGGKLIAQWSNVPPEEALAKALVEAR